MLLREFAKPRGERVGKLFPASHADADVERHAREAVLLHLFHGDRGGSAEDDEVVENPAEVDEEGRDLRVGGDDRLVDADGEPREIERDQNEDGLGDPPVDVLFVDRHPLGRDVELPFVREDEGDGRRKKDVPGEHRFVDGPEEGIAVAPLQDLVRDGRVHHVRNHVGEDGRGRRVDDVDVGEHVGQRRGEKHQTRQSVQKVHHRVEETEALRKREALPREGVVQAEDLNHSSSPADALAHVRRERFGRKARSDGLRDEGRLPAEAVELQGRVGVFRHGFHRDPADLHERGAAHDGARAAEHHGVPGVVPLLNKVVKERIFNRHRPLEVKVLLEGVGRIEVVRRLHERDLLVLHKPADGGRQKVAGRHVVAVEDHDEFAVRDPEGVIDVPGLGVVVLFALDVANAHGFGEFAEGVAASVVK